MLEFDFKRYKEENYYNIFNCRIQLHSEENNAVFAHEFYHHLQNFTTIQGAERMSYFIQILAHTALLSKTTDTLYVPFDKWVTSETIPTEASSLHELEQIYLHANLWRYLEQVESLYELPPHYKNRHGELGLVDVDYFNEGEKVPMPLMVLKEVESDRVLGQPIGGFHIAESGAFSLEQLHSEEPFPIEDLLDGSIGYQYHAIPFLIAQKLKNPRKVYLASFLICDLAMVISTPMAGIQIMYQYWQRELYEGMSESAIVDLYRKIYDENRDIIQQAIQLEKESLLHTRETLTKLELSDDDLTHVLIHQIDLMLKGLQYRLEHPLFIIENLLKPLTPATIGELMKTFPVNKITVGEKNTHFLSQQSVDNYQILNALLEVYLALKQYPDVIRLVPEDLNDKIPYNPNKFQFDSKNLNSDTLQFSIFPSTDENNEVNLEGYILQHLDLVGKKFVYLQ